MVTILPKSDIRDEFVEITKSDIHVIDLDLIKTIENKIINIIENDRKLDNPVFLFIQEGVISQLAFFLARNVKRPIAIGVAGATASGKSTFAYDIISSILKFQRENELDSLITRVNTDDYYYDRSAEVEKAGSFDNFAKNYDFDIPEALELDLLKRHIEQLVMGNDVMLPKYDMSGTAKRYDNDTLAIPSPIIISEGQYNLTDNIKDAFDICIYVDVSLEAQKERWFERAEKRGLRGDAAWRVYSNAVSKAEIHVKPTKQNAHIVVNGEASREAYRQASDKFLEIALSMQETAV